MTNRGRKRHVNAVRIDLDRIVREALANAPFPIRRLAKESGVSPALLTLIQQGKRAATRDVALRLATVFQRWGAQCARTAKDVQRAALRVSTPAQQGKR